MPLFTRAGVKCVHVFSRAWKAISLFREGEGSLFSLEKSFEWTFLDYL